MFTAPTAGNVSAYRVEVLMGRTTVIVAEDTTLIIFGSLDVLALGVAWKGEPRPSDSEPMFFVER